MSKEPRCSGMAEQDGPSQSMSGFSAWQSSCTWLFGPAADLLSYCVHWLTSKPGSSLDVNNPGFSVGYNCSLHKIIFFLFCCHLSVFEGCCLCVWTPGTPMLHTVSDPSCSVPASLKHNWVTQDNCSCLYLEVSSLGLAERFVNSMCCPLFSIYFNQFQSQKWSGEGTIFLGIAV